MKAIMLALALIGAAGVAAAQLATPSAMSPVKNAEIAAAPQITPPSDGVVSPPSAGSGPVSPSKAGSAKITAPT